MRTTLRLGALAGALLLAAPLAARANLILDSFQERSGAAWPNATSVTDPSLPPTSESGFASVLGSRRDSALGNSNMDVSGFDSASGDIFNLNGFSFLDYRSSVGAAATLELGYGAGSSLNILGLSGLQIDFLNYDAADTGPLHVSVTLFHGAASQQFGADAIQHGAQSLFIATPFAGQSVDRIVVDFIAPKGTDYRIDALTATTVPEPASLSLLALAASTLCLRRRKRTAR